MLLLWLTLAAAMAVLLPLRLKDNGITFIGFNSANSSTG